MEEEALVEIQRIFTNTAKGKFPYRPKEYAEKSVQRRYQARNSLQEGGQVSIKNRRAQMRLLLFGILLMYLADGS